MASIDLPGSWVVCNLADEEGLLTFELALYIELVQPCLQVVGQVEADEPTRRDLEVFGYQRAKYREIIANIRNFRIARTSSA